MNELTEAPLHKYQTIHLICTRCGWKHKVRTRSATLVHILTEYPTTCFDCSSTRHVKRDFDAEKEDPSCSISSEIT